MGALDTGTDYEPSTAAADHTWPDALAQRIGELVGALADPDTPDDMAVGDAVRGLTLIPGIDDARLVALPAVPTTVDQRNLPVGQRHLLELTGPATARADIMQAADLVAKALAARLRDAPGPPSGSARSRLAVLEEFHQVIGRNSPFLVSVHDEDGTLRWLSRTPGQTIDPPATGDLLSDVTFRVHPEDREELNALRNRLVAESLDLGEIDVRVSDSGEEWRTARIIVRNLTRDPAVHGIVSYAIDVTALHRAQYRLRIESARLRTLINSIQVAILVVDQDLRVAEVNAMALDLMGITAPPPALVGANMTELVERQRSSAPGVLAVAAEFTERAIGGGAPIHGEEVHLPGGVVLEADYLPIGLDGEVRSHVLVGREVTGRAAAQHALEARNRELADLAMLKTEFLATVSHELRTPLAAASSLLQLLDEDDGDRTGRTGSVRHDIVEALRRNTDRLLGIVEDLLLLARFEANQLPLDMRPTPVHALLRTSLDQLHPAIESRAATTTGPDHELDAARLVGDPHWLGRMIRYVVAGSSSSGQDGSGVVVREDLDAQDWTMTVSGNTPPTAGTGPGESGDPGDKRIGLGLSLTLARAIARRHGGDLRIGSDNGGASITISLPVLPGT